MKLKKKKKKQKKKHKQNINYSKCLNVSNIWLTLLESLLKQEISRNLVASIT